MEADKESIENIQTESENATPTLPLADLDKPKEYQNSKNTKVDNANPSSNPEPHVAEWLQGIGAVLMVVVSVMLYLQGRAMLQIVKEQATTSYHAAMSAGNSVIAAKASVAAQDETNRLTKMIERPYVSFDSVLANDFAIGKFPRLGVTMRNGGRMPIKNVFVQFSAHIIKGPKRRVVPTDGSALMGPFSIGANGEKFVSKNWGYAIDPATWKILMDGGESFYVNGYLTYFDPIGNEKVTQPFCEVHINWAEPRPAFAPLFGECYDEKQQGTPKPRNN